MTFTDLPRMFVSDTQGWKDLARMHPSSVRLMLFYVVPMSLIPPLTFLYAATAAEQSIFPPMVPALSAAEALVVAGVFLAAEIGMVLLMGTVIQEMGELAGTEVAHEQALLLAAVAPTPLWLAPLTLFVPSLAMNLLVLALAWFGCAALVYHGVPLLFGLDKARANLVARHVLVAGVLAWIALMVVQVMLMSLILGWR